VQLLPETTLWFYPHRKLLVGFGGRNHRVDYLLTENPSERTTSGVGGGSTKKDVIRHVPGAYGHVIEELEDAPLITAEDAIRSARAEHTQAIRIEGRS
jgi:hypothetical protein